MATQPNILFILADQHRADVLGCAGHPDVKTPHIDRIAAAGVRYENCFCCYPVCTPSRYALLSGRYVHENRCWTNHCTLLPEFPAFPRLLKQAGYSTAAVGKMHFTPTYQDVGFERLQLCEQNGPGRWDDDYHRMLMAAGAVDVNDLEDQEQAYRDAAPDAYWQSRGVQVSNLPDRLHSTTWIGDRAMEELNAWSADRPNLLMVGFVKPHHPMDPPAPWHTLYNPAKLQIPADYTPAAAEIDLLQSAGFFPHVDLDEPTLRHTLAYYYATISHLDREVGRMLDLLARRGLLDNTVVVYAADHGDYVGSHHLMLKGGAMYDPLVRVPLIIRYPGGRRAGTVVAGQVGLIDLARTLCAQAGLAFPAGKEPGLDLAVPGAGRAISFAESRFGGKNTPVVMMARTPQGKLLIPADGSTLPARYYDLQRDPYEQFNRIAAPECQAEIARLRTALAAWHGSDWQQPTALDENAAEIRQPNVPATPAARDALRRQVKQYMWEQMRAQGYAAPPPQ